MHVIDLRLQAGAIEVRERDLCLPELLRRGRLGRRVFRSFRAKHRRSFISVREL
jgi:hypothetical protein